MVERPVAFFCWFEASVRPAPQDFERPNGTPRSAAFSVFPVVITIGNHRVFKGPDDLNGYGLLLCSLSHICLKGGASFKEFRPFFFASGGFGADFTQNSLLATCRPDLLHLPTTNGEHCTGEAMGAITFDHEWAQLHPTGMVKPYDPVAKIKFLAAEALREVGDLLV